MEQLDVTTSFLYANLEEEVYLEIPKGMFEEEMLGKVLRLFKALYGLKQSPRMWNMHMDRALSEFGLKRLTSDFCVYAIHQGGRRILLGLFVDDMFVIGKVMELIVGVKGFLHSKFKMKDLGATTFLLGMEIRRLPGGMCSCSKRSTWERCSCGTLSSTLGQPALLCPPAASSAKRTRQHLQQTRQQWQQSPTAVPLDP